MKKTLNLLMTFWIVALASCSADEPQTISPTEDYNREFVNEFGVPAEGHDFSMATTAGLKVTSKNGDHITVTAEIDGKEYLFAECHVPAGTTALPVTIPRAVSELKISTGNGARTVTTNALVNLDDIKTDMVINPAKNPDDNPYLAFRQADFLDEFFTAYPQEESSLKNIGESYLFRKKEGYIFPVYYKSDRNNVSDYKVLISDSSWGRQNDVWTAELRFDYNPNPFSSLKYMPSSYTAIEEITSLYDHAFSSKPYPGEDYTDEIIICRGIKVQDVLDPTRMLYSSKLWYLELQYGCRDSGDFSLSSESPCRNQAFWNGYYDVPLQGLNLAYFSTCHFKPTNQEYYIYDRKNDLTGDGGSFFAKLTLSNAYLIGFNTAPTQAASEDIRDYCDVVFLYIPTEKTSWATVNSPDKYIWTIAAEDLGATDDWDFNDAVFTFSDQIKDLNTVNRGASSYNTREWGPRDAEPVRVLTVTPKAAGGTMPLYITYTGKVSPTPTIPDGTNETALLRYSAANEIVKQFTASLDNLTEATYIVGKEIHSWLGADSYKTMINTGTTNQNPKPQSVEFAIPVETQLGAGYDVSTGTFEYKTLKASVANKNICGFAVLVDKNNTLGIDAMNDSEHGMHRADDLVIGKGTYLIGRPDASNGEIAPQMILVNNGYWCWPQERIKISDAYPDFPAWLADPASAPTWANNYIRDKVTY